MPLTLMEEVDIHGTISSCKKARDIDRDFPQIRHRYRGHPNDYNHNYQGPEYPVPDACVTVEEDRLNRYTLTDVALDGGAYTNPDKTEHYATPTAGHRQLADPLFAENLANQTPPRPNIILIGPGVPAYSAATAEVILSPSSAHPTVHSGSSDDTSDSQSEEAKDGLNDGAFAPGEIHHIMLEQGLNRPSSETPDSCPASPCYHRFRFSTHRELDTYFDNSTVGSLAHNMTFAFGPNDLNGAHCLLSLAMSSGR